MSKKFSYINILNANWPHFEKEITSEEWMCICALSVLTVPQKCTLHYNGNDEEDAIYEARDFCKVLDKNERQCKLLIESLLNKEVLIQDKENREYILNPYIMLKGNEITAKVYILAEKTRWYKYIQESDREEAKDD